MITYDKLVITQPWKLELQQDSVDEANIPLGQVLVKKLYTIISAGTELACLSGREGWFSLPGSPGYGGVCRVEAVAADVEAFAPGDVVYCRAKHTAYELFPACELLRVPGGLDPMLVPYARMAGISATSTRISGIEFGDDVAVVGQGMVGNLAMQLAQLQGANVIAMDTSNHRLELAKKCGARHVLNPTNGDIAGAMEKLLDGRKVTTLIDATGSSKVILDSFRHIAWGGEMILLGSPRAEYSGNITEVFRYAHMGKFNINIRGAHEQCFPDQPNRYSKHSIHRTVRILMEYLMDGRLCVKPLTSHVEKPNRAPEIYEHLRQGDETYVGVLLDWND